MSSGTSNWKLSLCLLALAAAACTQVARQPRQSAVPWWEAEGNPPGAEGVQQDTSAQAVAEAEEGVSALEAAAPPDSIAAAGEKAHPPAAVEGPDSLAAAAPDPRPAPAGTAPPPEVESRPPERPAPSREVVQAQRRAYESRTGEDRERVERVNEYALWCIERGLWEEARIHLEQAVAVDSLSASLHNNLGILYERLGEREKARAAYEFAARLAPAKRLYQANLSYLRRAAEARGVPADSVYIDGLPRARERRRGTAPARETPEEG